MNEELVIAVNGTREKKFLRRAWDKMGADRNGWVLKGDAPVLVSKPGADRSATEQQAIDGMNKAASSANEKVLSLESVIESYKGEVDRLNGEVSRLQDIVDIFESREDTKEVVDVDDIIAPEVISTSVVEPEPKPELNVITSPKKGPSNDVNALVAITKISKIDTPEGIEEYALNDTRGTVLKAVASRIKTLKK